jgi:flagella synthesis protein FlgN
LAQIPFAPALQLVLECEATRRFVDILEREQFALQQVDVSSLDSLTGEKTHQLEQLAEFADARRGWLTLNGYTTDREGMERALHDHPGSYVIWRDLLGLAETAVQMNKINGSLIDRHLRHNQQKLRIMRAAIQPVNLYGSDGQTQTVRPARRFDEA